MDESHSPLWYIALWLGEAVGILTDFTVAGVILLSAGAIAGFSIARLIPRRR